jgi:hypothetical protein
VKTPPSRFACAGDENADAVPFVVANGPMSFEAPEAFPSGLPIAGDGFGNFWILDLTRLFAYAAPEKRPGLLRRLFA